MTEQNICISNSVNFRKEVCNKCESGLDKRRVSPSAEVKTVNLIYFNTHIEENLQHNFLKTICIKLLE